MAVRVIRRRPRTRPRPAVVAPSAGQTHSSHIDRDISEYGDTDGYGGPIQSTGPVAGEPLVLVAGARGAAVHTLVQSLLVQKVADLPAPTGGSREALRLVQGRLPHTPRDTYLVVSAAQKQEAPPTFETPSRRVRRFDARVDDPLLELFTIVAARAVTGPAARDRLTIQLVDRCHCLVLVTDGRFPYQPAEVELLRAAMARQLTIFLAVTHVDEGAGWVEVVAANQTLLGRQFRPLAWRTWYPIGRGPSGGSDLRRALFDWGSRFRVPIRSGRPGPAVRLRRDAAESAWRNTTERSVERERAAILVRLGKQLDALLASPADSAGGAGLRAVVGPAGVEDSTGPAARLAHRLQTISVELRRDLDSAVRRTLDAVLADVLAEPAHTEVIERILEAVRRDVSLRTSDLPRCYRVLRITRTGIVAISTARTPVPALAAHREAGIGVFPPLGIGVTASAAAAAPDWLPRSVQAVRVELEHELSRQFAHLRAALTELVAEAVDHDLLLI